MHNRDAASVKFQQHSYLYKTSTVITAVSMTVGLRKILQGPSHRRRATGTSKAGGKRIHFPQEETPNRIANPKCLTLNRYVYRQYLLDPKCMFLCMCVYMRVGEYMCSCVYVSHVYIMYYYVTINTTKEEDINLKGGEFDVVEDGA